MNAAVRASMSARALGASDQQACGVALGSPPQVEAGNVPASTFTNTGWLAPAPLRVTAPRVGGRSTPPTAGSMERDRRS